VGPQSDYGKSRWFRPDRQCPGRCSPSGYFTTEAGTKVPPLEQIQVRDFFEIKSGCAKHSRNEILVDFPAGHNHPEQVDQFAERGTGARFVAPA
jgi:hypothetical protein